MRSHRMSGIGAKVRSVLLKGTAFRRAKKASAKRFRSALSIVEGPERSPKPRAEPRGTEYCLSSGAAHLLQSSNNLLSPRISHLKHRNDLPRSIHQLNLLPPNLPPLHFPQRLQHIPF